MTIAHESHRLIFQIFDLFPLLKIIRHFSLAVLAHASGSKVKLWYGDFPCGHFKVSELDRGGARIYLLPWWRYDIKMLPAILDPVARSLDTFFGRGLNNILN